MTTKVVICRTVALPRRTKDKQRDIASKGGERARPMRSLAFLKIKNLLPKLVERAARAVRMTAHRGAPPATTRNLRRTSGGGNQGSANQGSQQQPGGGNQR